MRIATPLVSQGYGIMPRACCPPTTPQATVKNVAQRCSIHSIVGADGNDPGPRFPPIPFVTNCNVHALAHNLKDNPSARFFVGMDHTFASINASRELARGFPQRFQGKRLFRVVAPRAEVLRVMVPMTMIVMPTCRRIKVGRMIGLVMQQRVIELRGIEPADRQQDFQRHISAA